MSYRKKELHESGIEGIWLNEESASEFYEYALKFMSNEKWGFDRTKVTNIVEHKVDDEETAKLWLVENMENTSLVYVVFGPKEVLGTGSKIILENWSDLFLPSRDDVLVLAQSGPKIAFYWHEDVWFVGERKN